MVRLETETAAAERVVLARRGTARRGGAGLGKARQGKVLNFILGEHHEINGNQSNR